MTAVVGYTDGNRTWIGADSLATASTMSKAVSVSPKVFRSGSVIVGFSDSFRVGQILIHQFQMPQLLKATDAGTWVCRQFIPCLWDTLLGYDLIHDNLMDSELLIGLRGRLFEVSPDFGVHEYDCAYTAVGSGGDLCKGVMYATEGSQLKPPQRLKMALRAAQKFNCSVGEPFSVISVR